MTDEQALDRVRHLSKELTRTDLSPEEVKERYLGVDEQISKEILSLIHEYPIMFDCELNDYRLETEEEVKLRRHTPTNIEKWIKSVKHPFMR